MKKSFILLAFLLFLALSVFGQQKTDSAFIKALNQNFNFEPSADSSIIKAEDEGRYYLPGRVIISFTQEHFQNIKEVASLAAALKNIPSRTLLEESNDFLKPLGIDYSLMFFKRSRRDSNYIEFIMVRTKPGQSVVDAISDLKKHFPIHIRSIGPEWLQDKQPNAWK